MTQTAAKNTTQSIAALRRALVAKYGKRNYKITRCGEVYAFGTMTTHARRGWHFLGYVGDTYLYLCLGLVSID